MSWWQILICVLGPLAYLAIGVSLSNVYIRIARPDTSPFGVRGFAFFLVLLWPAFPLPWMIGELGTRWARR